MNNERDDIEEGLFRVGDAAVGHIPPTAPFFGPAIPPPMSGQSLVMRVEPTEARKVILHTANLTVTFIARKVELQENVVGLVVARSDLDLEFQLSSEYSLVVLHEGEAAHETLQILYVGGKVCFGEFVLLSFIRKPKT